MPDNGSGNFVPLATGFPFQPDTLIDASIMDPLLLDMATGLSNRICKDGQTSLTAHLPFNGFKAINMAPGTARTDSATLANIQDGTGVFVSQVGGTGDAITLSVFPAINTYAVGQTFRFLALAANTGPVTIQVSGLPLPKALTSTAVTPLIAGDLRTGDLLSITYDGTRFILNAPPARGPYTNQSLTNPVISNGTVTADPTVPLGLVSKQYVDALWTTGDAKLTWKIVADAGWILHDDGTIGNAVSGATTRAHNDTSALYTLWWTNLADAEAPVTGGRGSTAAADFAAAKPLRMPLALGRELAVAGAGSGLTSRVLGEALGSEDAITVSHTHTVAHTHNIALPDTGAQNAPVNSFVPDAIDNLLGYGTTESATPTTSSAGSSGTGANLSPRTHLNLMIKL